MPNGIAYWQNATGEGIEGVCCGRNAALSQLTSLLKRKLKGEAAHPKLGPPSVLQVHAVPADYLMIGIRPFRL